MGGSLKAVVGPEELRITGQVLTEGLPRLLAVLADCLTGAGYEPARLEAERERLLHRIRLTESMPARTARAALLRRCFGDHPATRETPPRTRPQPSTGTRWPSCTGPDWCRAARR